MNTKTCSKCGETKDTSLFCRNRYSRDGYHSHCKSCVNANTAKWRKEHPEIWKTSRHKHYLKNKDRWREYHRLRNYGVTAEKYQELLQKQEGKCAICGKEPTENKPLYVDHNHMDDRVRGLLCLECNAALGLFYDSPHLLQQAMTYLRNDYLLTPDSPKVTDQ